MASRQELEIRGRAVDLDPTDYPNDSVFEQAIAKKEDVQKPLTGGDRPSKLVRTGNRVRKWVTGGTKEELEEGIAAAKEEQNPPSVDINVPQKDEDDRRRDSNGRFTK